MVEQATESSFIGKLFWFELIALDWGLMHTIWIVPTCSQNRALLVTGDWVVCFQCICVSR
jgi:hypothetical protein